MSDDDPFFQYMRDSDFFGNSYTNANHSYTNANQFQNNSNTEQHYRFYDESNSYDKGESSGYGYDTNNTGENEDENESGNSENEDTQAENEETANEAEGNGVDYSDNFVFDYTFNTFEEVFDHINEVAYGLGFHLIKYKYHMDKSPPYKIVTCERCGPYRSGVKDPDNPLRGSRTKKLECPFAVRVINRSVSVWEVVPKCGLHSHHFGKFLDGHRRRAKLTEEQKEFIKQQRQSHVKPGMVRHGFTLMFPNQPAPVLKQIYNENARLSEQERDGRNVVQHMLDIASEANYLTDFMSDPETKALTHVWFAHPEAVEMFKAWPYVVLIDSTYKTNKYDLILVQCVGVTPVGKSFLIGYALIKKETKKGYVWVLRRLLALLGPDLRPSVIVTDHERGLLAALPDVFPNMAHFLCLWHIYNAVEAYTTNYKKDGNFGKAVALNAWKKVIEAKTVGECIMEWNDLKKRYCRHPILTNYLETTWWSKVHMFAKCFTNQVLHFGNISTSRVESAHAQLNMWIGSAHVSLDNLWKRAHVMLLGKHIEIRKSLEDSISKRVVGNLYHGNIFSMLNGRVSSSAIITMQVEFNRGVDLGYNVDDDCGCTLWITHKLFCVF